MVTVKPARGAVLLAAFVSSVTCASKPGPHISEVRTIDEARRMTACNYLGVVEGTAGRTKFSNAALTRHAARREALEIALTKGATHVRWLQESVDWASMQVTAQAFDCSARRAEPPRPDPQGSSEERRIVLEPGIEPPRSAQ
jgi:hypothetical protein